MSQKYIGFDLGGINLRPGIVDLENGQVSHLLSTPTLVREGHDAVIDLPLETGLLPTFRASSSWLQTTQTQQVEFGAAIHLSFEQF